jgi:alkaline phosphatase D
MKKISLLLIAITACAAAFGQLPPRPAVNSLFAPFYHGVASGDPLSDRVIIWTRVTPVTMGTTITVHYQVATDTFFTAIVDSGTVTTDSSVDYTVKVDATGLTANTWYYYRFKSGGTFSIPGRTKTLPVGNADSIRLAVFSCSDFQTGYFNAYNDISKRNDISAVVHLGDWYYEYLAGGSDASGDTSRYHPLSHDAYTLSDYRLWHSQYKLDQDLMAMLEQYPLIAVWDDHESANNSWYSSAENHNAATQGNWFVRKNASKKAYFEWMPIREQAPGNDTIIHRNFKFGNLFNLIMLDTRLEGRDSSLGTLLSPTNAYMIDTTRKLLGTTQLSWLKSQLSDTSARWKLLGSQVMVAPLVFLGSVLNGDQWDGYPAERNRVFNYISQNNIADVCFLSGDIHSSWASDLPGADSSYHSSTGAGSVATEFIGSSITSPANIPGVSISALELADPYFKYVDFSNRGYLLFDVNKNRAQGDYIHMSSITSRTYTSTDAAQWQNLNGERHLRTAPSVLGANPGNPPLVHPIPATSVQNVNNIVVFSAYPNPTSGDFYLQYYLAAASNVRLTVVDMAGRCVYSSNVGFIAAGVNNAAISLNGLENGVYTVSIEAGNAVYSCKVAKNK